MSATEHFLATDGRLGRGAFALRVLVLAGVVALVHHFAVGYFDHHHEELRPLGYFAAIVAAVICGLAGLAQIIKRVRDAGRPVFLTLLTLVPGVNLLFLAFLLVAPSRG